MGLLTAGVGVSLTFLPAFWLGSLSSCRVVSSSLDMRVGAQSPCIMLCCVQFTLKPALFWKQTEAQWIWGRGQVEAKQVWEGRGPRGDCSQDIRYEGRINKKITVPTSHKATLWLCLTSLRLKSLNRGMFPPLVRHSLLSSDNCLVLKLSLSLLLPLIPTTSNVFLCCLTYDVPKSQWLMGWNFSFRKESICLL